MSYKAMAKNVFQKKKRIAHFQSSSNFTNGENDNALSGCFDYVSSIIDNMDSSFKFMQSDCSKIHAKRKSIDNDNLNNSNSNKASSSSHKGSGRKFTMSRKFPLMEKSQKILKQIKHNRNISKPRAHLAALPKSPVKVDTSKVLSVKKRKENLVKHESIVKKNPEICSTTRSDISALKLRGVHNTNFQNNSKASKKNQNILHKEKNTTSISFNEYSENEHLYDVNNKLDNDASMEKNSLSDAKASKDSGNETTDSEYERFVKKNRKGLRKKIIKIRKKSSAPKNKPVKELKKRVLKQYDSDKSDNDDNNTSLSKNSRKGNCFKKCKIAKVCENANEESERTVDVLTQDSSSENDAISNNAYIYDRTELLDAEDACSALCEADLMHDSDSGSETTLSDVMMDNKKLAPETSSIIINNVEPKICITDVFSSRVSSSSDTGKTTSSHSTSNLVIDLCSDNESETGVCSDYSNLCVPMQGKNTGAGDSISIFKSDDKHNNTVSKENTLDSSNQEKILIKDAQNVSNLESEESDIEIIEVVTSRSKDKCIPNVAANMLDSSKSAANSKQGQAIENNIVSNVSNRNSQLTVKTEKLNRATDVENHNIKTEDSKYKAAYMTNICNGFDQDKLINLNQKTLSSECCELLGRPLKDTLVAGTLLQRDVKQENESDDDIIILNSVQTGDTSDFSSYERFKTETPDIFVESLNCVKYSAHKILKMEIDNYSQNPCETPQVIEEIDKNIKNEHVDQSLSTLKNKCSIENANSKIKNTSFVKDMLKLHDNMCSSTLPTNLSGVTYEGNQKCINLKQRTESHLMELYKKEFSTYQEIVQTEASVSASLKLLEVRQAEKVECIRSLVQKYIATDQNFKDNSVNKNILKDLLPSSSISKTDVLVLSKLDNDIKPNISGFDTLQNAQLLKQTTPLLKKEPESSQQYLNSSNVKTSKKQTLKLLNEKCNLCGKEAMAACQNCAKVFFCSHACGRKFWNDGHMNECGK